MPSDWTSRAITEKGRHGAGGPYEIDRDRIIHCDAFRDLQHKTQVQAVVPERPAARFRTRLNHVIEVAQIARGLAEELGADTALVEAISLAHDLGHPPFGHAGERALSDAMRERGLPNWSANGHSLVVVDWIECAFIGWRGLNLTFATREGIARHSTPFDRPQGWAEFETQPQSGIESQIVDAADVLAFLSHDLDDALTAGLIKPDDLRRAVPDFADLATAPDDLWESSPWPNTERPHLRQRRLIARLIGRCIRDIAATTQARLAEQTGGDPVRSIADRVVAYSPRYERNTKHLLELLQKHYYGSDEIRCRDDRASALMLGLFDALMRDQSAIPERFASRDKSREATVANYIASLTDPAAVGLAVRLKG